MTRDSAAVIAVVLLAALLAVGAVTAPAVAQQADNSTPTITETATATATPTPTTTATPTPDEPSPDGEYTADFLRKNGVTDNTTGVASSARQIGDPAVGWMAVRYRDPTLVDTITGNPGAYQHVSPNRVIQKNEIQVYGSVFDEDIDDTELVIVYWQSETVNGTERAVNQTADRHSIDMQTDGLVASETISLREHTDDEWEMTMWIEQGGERIEGVQWHTAHLSNPFQTTVGTMSAASRLAYAITTVFIPAVVSVISGLFLAKLALRRIGRFAGYGIQGWMMFTGFVSFFLAMTAYYQISIILYHLPWVVGASVGVVAFAFGLTMHEPVEYIEFRRVDLLDAVTVPGGTPHDYRDRETGEAAADGGHVDDSALTELFDKDAGAEVFDELTEATFVDKIRKPAVRTEDGYRIVPKGIRPAIARFFSDAALLDVRDIATRREVGEGEKIDKEIMVDPRSDPPIEHKPSHFKRVLPIDKLGARYEDSDETASVLESIWAWVLTAAIVAVPPFGLASLANFFNIPMVGFVAGALITVAIAYSAEDGWIDYVPAPPHFVRAEDNLAALLKAWKVSKEDMTNEERAREEKAITSIEARRDKTAQERTVTEKMIEDLGMGDALDLPEGETEIDADAETETDDRPESETAQDDD